MGHAPRELANIAPLYMRIPVRQVVLEVPCVQVPVKGVPKFTSAMSITILKRALIDSPFTTRRSGVGHTPLTVR